MKLLQKSALLIIGHGSTVNPDSSRPYLLHAEKIRKKGIFAEVHTAFWKEEPSMKDVFYMIESQEIFIVPDFISEGYFTQEILPRELGVKIGRNQVNGKILHYTLPVGTHSLMTDLLVSKADKIVSYIPKEKITLFLFGHGTSFNSNSTKAIKNQVQFIKERKLGYFNIFDAYLEEKPFIKDCIAMSNTPYILALPFFIADGLHTYEDIPKLLGIQVIDNDESSIFDLSPFEIQGKQFFYGNSIGNESAVSEIILERVFQCIS